MFFTLEIISWVAPFTVDKIILTASRRNQQDKTGAKAEEGGNTSAEADQEISGTAASES